MRVARRVFLVVLLALVTSATASAAQPTWLHSEQLSPNGFDASDPTVAMAPDGTVIAAWIQTPAGGCCAPQRDLVPFDLAVRVRPPGGSFGPAQIVDSGDVARPALAIDQSGEAVLAWTSNAGDSVNTAVRPPGGTFGGIETYTGEKNADSLFVSLDPQGNATLVWRRILGPNPPAVRTGYRPAGGSLTPAQTLDSTTSSGTITDHIQELTAASNAAGDAVAVWRHEFDNSSPSSVNQTFNASVRPSGGSWSAPVQLDSLQDLSDVVAGVDAAGNALLAWTHGFNNAATVYAKYWPHGGVPGTLEQPAAAGGAHPQIPRLAMEPSGTAVIGWVSSNGLEYDTRSPGGSYGPVGLFASPGFGLDLTAGPTGQTIARWSDGSGAEHAAVRPPGGPFGPPSDPASGATPNSDFPTALDGQGNGVAEWTQGDGAETHAWAAGLDAAPPTLTGVSVQSPVISGDFGIFSVNATDVWSPVTTIWSSGAGSQVASSLAALRYPKPGRYTATATSTDAVGFSSSVSGPVQVIPLLGSFGMTRRTFAVGPKPTPRSAVKLGTTFRFKLATAAQLNLTIGRKTRGVRVGKRCRTPGHHATGKRRKRCTFFKTAGMLVRSGHQGANSFAFSGRIGRRPLSPGAYRAVAFASDSGSGTFQRSLRFRIVLARRARG